MLLSREEQEQSRLSCRPCWLLPTRRLVDALLLSLLISKEIANNVVDTSCVGTCVCARNGANSHFGSSLLRRGLVYHVRSVWNRPLHTTLPDDSRSGRHSTGERPVSSMQCSSHLRTEASRPPTAKTLDQVTSQARRFSRYLARRCKAVRSLTMIAHRRVRTVTS